MPEPHDGESHDDWMQRCMGDEEQRRSTPDAEQRSAVCQSKWEKGGMMRRPMKSKPDWLRASITSKAIGVDRENNILRGYVIAQEGPFKSDGRGAFDKRSLDTLFALASAKPGGLKSRFTHPDMSNDGLGKFLGRARDPFIGTAIDARTGKTVAALRGNLHFDKTALDTPPEGGKPLGVYVMDLAESDPDALSSSIVVEADQEEQLDREGKPKLDAKGNPLPPIWRPTALHASDVVDTGDAVDGLLSTERLDIERLPLSVLWKGSQLLDAVFLDQPRDVVEARLLAYIQRYLDRKFGEPPPAVPTPKLDARRLRMEEMTVIARKVANGTSAVVR